MMACKKLFPFQQSERQRERMKMCNKIWRYKPLPGLGKGDPNFVASPETLKLCSVSSSIFRCLKIDTKEASIFKRLKIDTTKYACHLTMR